MLTVKKYRKIDLTNSETRKKRNLDVFKQLFFSIIYLPFLASVFKYEYISADFAQFADFLIKSQPSKKIRNFENFENFSSWIQCLEVTFTSSIWPRFLFAVHLK